MEQTPFETRKEVVDAILEARRAQGQKLQAWFDAAPDNEAQDAGFREYSAANDEVNRLISIYNDLREK